MRLDERRDARDDECRAEARRADGRPTFPILHDRDAHGKLQKVRRGALPSIHSFRHTMVSRSLAAGESVDEIAFLLGHRDANVTRAVYVREIADNRRRASRRQQIDGRVLRDPPAGREWRAESSPSITC
jgi:integrase